MRCCVACVCYHLSASAVAFREHCLFSRPALRTCPDIGHLKRGCAATSLPTWEVSWSKKLFTLLDLCVSSLRRGHANLLCIVPILTDDPRRESDLLSAATARTGGRARQENHIVRSAAPTQPHDTRRGRSFLTRAPALKLRPQHWRF